MCAKILEDWDVWYPKAAATGISFARGRCDPTQAMLVHSAPPVLTVTVRTSDGQLLAQGIDLNATDETPMTRLTRRENSIHREDIWPTDGDIGTPVLLPGGEVGILLKWWHADDHSEWRWQIEFYNHR
jgi:hypothetical protein